MSRPKLRARSAPVLDEPRPNKALIAAFAFISPLYIRFALRFRRIRLIRGERLVEAFRDFQSGGSRLAIAFRHPYGDEPQLMAHAVAWEIPRAARRLGAPLARPAHAAFVHGYEVPLWLGPLVRWLLPRAGALSVHHVKFDAEGLRRIVLAMKDGEYPLALAPEGQVSYTSSSVPRLEQGFARISFWTAEALEKEGRTERTLVLPVSIHYRYGRRADRVLDRILGMAEAECGLPAPSADNGVGRIQAVAAAVVAAAERFYGLGGMPETGGSSLDERWERVIQEALGQGERMLGLPSDGTATHRFYRIRQAGWNRIYRRDLEGLTPLDRALADRRAGEAWYAMRHMETADIGYYLDFGPPPADASVDDLVERAANYWDLTSRLRGGNISDRLRFFRKDAYLVAGRPLDVGARLPEYRRSRKGALQALTDELDERYRECVADYLKEQQHVER
jgi:hypothetical protein